MGGIGLSRRRRTFHKFGPLFFAIIFVETEKIFQKDLFVHFEQKSVICNLFLALQVQTLIVKFLSCAFAVGCGMPVGYEGPMIHLGSLVAAGMSQFKSATFECTLPCFSRFRNSEDRRNFISAGAAAGIASAFGAPVGGLLFAMEEVSSFWKNRLSWQVS